MLKHSKRLVFLTMGHFCLVLGIIGIFLPLMPTTPFALLSAYFYSKGSKRLHNWLLKTRFLGPVISNWESSGVISHKAKISSTLSIFVIFGSSIYFVNVAVEIKMILVLIAISVLTFIWTRPSRRTKSDDRSRHSPI